MTRLTKLVSAALIALVLAGGASTAAMARPIYCPVPPEQCRPPTPPPPSIQGDPSQWDGGGSGKVIFQD